MGGNALRRGLECTVDPLRPLASHNPMGFGPTSDLGLLEADYYPLSSHVNIKLPLTMVGKKWVSLLSSSSASQASLYSGILVWIIEGEWLFFEPKNLLLGGSMLANYCHILAIAFWKLPHSACRQDYHGVSLLSTTTRMSVQDTAHLEPLFILRSSVQDLCYAGEGRYAAWVAMVMSYYYGMYQIPVWQFLKKEKLKHWIFGKLRIWNIENLVN